MTDRLKRQLKFLIEADKMKNVLRETLISDGARRENNAEHSWHIALMAMTLFEYAGVDGVDVHRVCRMAIVHDLVEIYAGDTFAYDELGNESKRARERDAADRLFSILEIDQAREYRELWEEFDQMTTPDALFAAAVDRLQPFINNYLTGGHTWTKYGVTSDRIYERMAPVKTALPYLWEFVEQVVNESRESGYIKN
jgi:putative hydrolase of HD superfamily